jgi:hydrogenase expression/formation protein HypD
MKYLNEFRDPQIIKKLSEQIKSICTQPWKIMEVCGGQTHSIVKHQLDQLLPAQIELVHGPGCPVCVTPQEVIDLAIHLALKEKVFLTSFGDMLRVPGSSGLSLQDARAQGARIEMVYSPLDAITLAKNNPQSQVVFLAVGFETTSLPNALALLRAKNEGVDNFYLLAHQVRVPPAISSIMDHPDTRVQGFLAAGHVCTVTGATEYVPICQKYKVPIVITGFEPVDVLCGIKQLIEMLETGISEVKIQYTRSVKPEGNPEGLKILNTVFEIGDQSWRGLGEIPESGRLLRTEFSRFDALKKWQTELNLVLKTTPPHISSECQSAKVLQGLLKPKNCPHFAKACTPQNPLGAPMVSSEGACAAYFDINSI